MQPTSAKQERVILFTRYPEPGKTKTRLIPALGMEGAADLQRQMTEHIFSQLTVLQQNRTVNLEVRYGGGNRNDMKQWLSPGINFLPQEEGDLGNKLQRCFDEAFSAKIKRVVVVGADCPGLSCEIMEKSLDMLFQKDLVLGPAEDGGYYLVGLSRPIPALFHDIPWGTDQVLNTTLAYAAKKNLTFSLLEPLADVDRPEDIHHFRHHSHTE